MNIRYDFDNYKTLAVVALVFSYVDMFLRFA